MGLIRIPIDLYLDHPNTIFEYQLLQPLNFQVIKMHYQHLLFLIQVSGVFPDADNLNQLDSAGHLLRRSKLMEYHSKRIKIHQQQEELLLYSLSVKIYAL